MAHMEGEIMNDELRLVALGFPLSEAVSICQTMRRDGILENFINELERDYMAAQLWPDMEAV
jgi:hypothetical protein